MATALTSFLFALLLAAETPPADPQAPEPKDLDLMRRITGQLELRVLDDAAGQVILCRTERVQKAEQIALFYAQRAYAPIWVDARGPLPGAYAMFARLQGVVDDGLQPENYHIKAIENIFEAFRQTQPDRCSDPNRINDDAGRLADLDLLLSDAFLLLSAHLSGGQVNPETLQPGGPDGSAADHGVDPAGGLTAVAGGQDIVGLITGARPSHEPYHKLRKARRQLRLSSGEHPWPVVPPGPSLQNGAADQRAALLRKRLQLSGDLIDPHQAAPDIFSPDLADAVRRFQLRHGLEADGVVGRQTLSVLNISTAERLRVIDLNLERWRWLPRELGRRHIQVNIAAFELKVIEDQRAALAMRVVVGRPARRTPVFSAPMTYLVFNPYWTIPHTIAAQDILPRILEHNTYLSQQGIKVFDGWSDAAKEVDPLTVNWSSYGPGSFPFRLRQDPGPMNALGRIKFMLPNKFSVYLHDTPNRLLFGRAQRDFSSGCIRLEDAPALAAYVLKDQPGWSPDAITKALSDGKQVAARLTAPIPVHLFYMTAWVDENNTLHFRQDIYQRDKALDRALRLYNASQSFGL